MKLNTNLIKDKDTGVYCKNKGEFCILRKIYTEIWYREYMGPGVYYPLDDGCQSTKAYAKKQGYKVYDFPSLVQPTKKKNQKPEIFSIL